MIPASGSTLGLGQFLGTGDGGRCVGGLVCRELVPTVPERQVATHSHPEAHLVFVLEGQYLSSASAAPAVAPAPTLIYNPPGTTHRDRFADLNGRFFTVSVDAQRLREWAALTALPTRPMWLGLPEARAAVVGLRLEWWRGDADAPLAAEHWAWSLALALAGTAALRSVPSGSWVSRTRDRLHDECTQPLCLDTLAADAGVHPGHLTRAFGEAFGCSPGQYQRLCRLERALGLLERSDMPLATIAADCGYADQSHLTRALRRHTRQSPALLRRQLERGADA